MRGGRGGRGRGGRGGFRGGFGQAQALPLTPIETYIYNPNCEERPELSEEEKQLVVLNRIITRSCNEGECYIHQEASVKLVRRYTDDFEIDIKNPEVQRRVLVDAIGPQFFPDELLAAKPPARAGKQVLGAKKTLNWNSLEAMEKSTGGGGKAAVDSDDDGADTEGEEEGVEHEDYGHDHYGDEDREDEFNDDNDAGGGDDY